MNLPFLVIASETQQSRGWLKMKEIAASSAFSGLTRDSSQRRNGAIPWIKV